MSVAGKNVPKLRFPGFSDEWEEKKLAKVSKLTSSKRVYLSDYVDDGIPFYRGKEISELRQNRKPKDILYISQSAYYDFKKKFGAPKKNEILITAVGTIGNVLRVRDDVPFYFKDGNLIWLQDIAEDPFFMEILLQTHKKDLLKTSIGSSQQALTIVGLNKLKLNYPKKDEQKKIAGFLTAVDDRISTQEKKVELLKKYKKGVMQKIFTQQIRFKDDKGKNYPDWQQKQLGEIAKIKTGNLNVDDANPDGAYEFFDRSVDIKKYHEYSFDNEALIYAGEGSEFYPRYFKGKYGLHQRAYTVFGNGGIVVKFLHYFMLTQNNHFLRFAVGSTVKSLRMDCFNKCAVPIPSTVEQQKIADFLTALDSKIELEENNLKQAKYFKKSLLQRMFV